MSPTLGDRPPSPTPQDSHIPKHQEGRSNMDRDEEMRGPESEADREAPVDPDLDGQALKRKRIERDEYTVSKSGQSIRDNTSLRKLPPQCSWDKEARSVPALAPPAELLAWIRAFGDKSPYRPEYDEAIYAAIPTYRYANPHFRATQQGELEERPLEGHDPFTPGPFPHIHISDWRHTGNILDQQKAMVKETGDDMLALIPHGGGRAYVRQGAVLAKTYEKCIRTFRFKGYDGEPCDIKVIPPDARNSGSEKSANQFAQPWAFYLHLKDDTVRFLRSYLIWQEHFAFDQSKSFSIYPIKTETPQTWKLLLFVCPDLDWADASHNAVLDRRAAILGTAKARLRAHLPYRDEVATLAATKIAHSGTRDQIFKTVTDSFHLEPVTADSKDGPVAAFILLARPLTNVALELKTLKRTMIDAIGGGARGNYFYVGSDKVLVVDDVAPNASITVDCKLCKSDMHRTADCPLPKTRGWRGITVAALGCEDKPSNERAADADEDDASEAISNVLSALRGDSKATASPKARKAKGKSGGNGGQWRTRGQPSGQSGGKGKAVARP